MKLKNTLAITSLVALFFFTEKTKAQTTVGGGLVYGTEVKNIGINVTGQFFIKENIAIAPSFTYYFPKEIAADYSFKWYEINADGNYYFDLDNSNIILYGLAGLNFSILTMPSFSFGDLASASATEFGGSGSTASGSVAQFGFAASDSATKFGFNIGAGADFNSGKNITPFAQIKYTLSSLNQLAIMAGVRFTLD